VDKLISGYELHVTSYPTLKSDLAETKLPGKKIVFAKPKTSMNKSGEAVLAFAKSYKLKDTSSLCVIHDDVDLELGKINIVKNRGSAGHKGVEDVMRKLKTQDFVRFRVGTRPKRLATKRSKALMNKFVASPIGKADQAVFKKAIKTCAEAVLFAIEEGFEKAAGKYNAK
jgi:PTH1 family peptidyl-tRNA hydrolase